MNEFVPFCARLAEVGHRAMRIGLQSPVAVPRDVSNVHEVTQEVVVDALAAVHAIETMAFATPELAMMASLAAGQLRGMLGMLQPRADERPDMTLARCALARREALRAVLAIESVVAHEARMRSRLSATRRVATRRERARLGMRRDLGADLHALARNDDRDARTRVAALGMRCVAALEGLSPDVLDPVERGALRSLCDRVLARRWTAKDRQAIDDENLLGDTAAFATLLIGEQLAAFAQGATSRFSPHPPPARTRTPAHGAGRGAARASKHAAVGRSRGA